MSSERIRRLFQIMQCSNTDIARFAGCSPSNISRIKNGSRELGVGSHAILRLAEGVYRYADYENMLSVLCELCGVEDTRADTMIPAIAAWIYEERDFAPPHTVIPKSKRERENRRHSFGERLDLAMTRLEFSNAQLAAALNVDVSLVSRYRSGVYSPHRNVTIAKKLSGILMARAQRTGRVGELAALCHISAEEFDLEALMEWLYQAGEDDPSELAVLLLQSIDDFVPGSELPASAPELPPIDAASCYRGTEGLRGAVVRFLSDAADEGGELLLYSDEPMEWMSGDREYFSLWATLMTACVRAGVKIKIIHNVDRDAQEMASAIRGWLPLYISGMIEPYMFRRARNPRFYHTMFLRPGGACIYGAFPASLGENRWYDYITDATRLESMEEGYASMIAHASPFLKTYPAAKRADFQRFFDRHPAQQHLVLSGLPVASMPEALLARMLSRAELTNERRLEIIGFYRERRRHFLDALARESVSELVCLPDREAIRSGGVRVNFDLELFDLALAYTPEEYAEHIAAVTELIQNERNYHLTLLPAAPFRDIQIITMKEAVAVLRCREPHAAFVFTSPDLTRSVADYFDSLSSQYASDRLTAIQTLNNLYE